jgi:hypothetical protein
MIRFSSVVLSGVVAVGLLAGCGAEAPRSVDAGGSVGTPETRAALFDTIYARTERREAFSPPKNAALGFDPLAAMMALRSKVIEAQNEEQLFYAIAEVGHARRDRHLDLALVPGGLQVSDSAGLDIVGQEELPPRSAALRVYPDYSRDDPAYFIGDVATASGTESGSEADIDVELPPIGGRILSVNGRTTAEWHTAATAFMRHSSIIGLKWKLAEAMSLATATFPPDLRSEVLTLEVEAPDGGSETYALPYYDAETLTWAGTGAPSYPGTAIALSTPTYDLHVPEVDARHVVLVWRGFRETMVPDVDALVEYAAEHDLLDRTLVMDVTRSRGGSLGPYAMQRLQPRAFKTTFGNLRLSDVTLPFVEDKRTDFEAQTIEDSGVREIIDDGTWLMEWLEEDVIPALERGDAYSNNVPFKSAHAPRDSDGILEPTPVHFRGPIVLISGPQGGSHLDQFASIIKDNELGAIVGMPPGGYSNTWEWDQVLTMPGMGRPLLSFMWNIGHSIRPNGEILEGNPIEVDEWVPLTPDNVTNYYGILLERALAAVEARR